DGVIAEYKSDVADSRCTAFFFFSSRRRHTRFDCDWSSDVCSSDLARRKGGHLRDLLDDHVGDLPFAVPGPAADPGGGVVGKALRSEERRVGKGGGARCVEAG